MHFVHFGVVSESDARTRSHCVAFFEQTENIKEKLTVDPGLAGLAIKIIDNGGLITLYIMIIDDD